MLTSKKAFSIALPLLSVSAYFNMVSVSQCLTGEEEIKADYIVQHRLFCLSVATKDYCSTVLKCPEWREPQSSATLESNHLKERCHLVKRAFSLMASRNFFFT